MLLGKLNYVAKEFEYKMLKLPYNTRVILTVIGLLFPYLLPMSFLILKKSEYAVTATITIIINLAAILFWEYSSIFVIFFAMLTLLSYLALAMIWVMCLFYLISTLHKKTFY